jgi:hypothetical protein
MLPLILSRLSVLRASVVVAALFSLCVSSNVGPRFLPLPVPDSAAAAAEASHEQQGTTASRSQSKEPGSFRVPMMAQGQKRADREPHPRSLAVMPGVDCVMSNDCRLTAEVIDPKISIPSALVSVPSGRAPPDLI